MQSKTKFKKIALKSKHNCLHKLDHFCLQPRASQPLDKYIGCLSSTLRRHSCFESNISEKVNFCFTYAKCKADKHWKCWKGDCKCWPPAQGQNRSAGIQSGLLQEMTPAALLCIALFANGVTSSLTAPLNLKNWIENDMPIKIETLRSGWGWVSHQHHLRFVAADLGTATIKSVVDGLRLSYQLPLKINPW